MAQVSQITDQTASIKRQKIHRAPLEIARKIVALEEIISSDSTKSARDVVKILHLPNSTMHTWREKKAAKEDETAVFFATPAGSALLSRLLLATMYNNKCGASGICGVQEWLRNSELDQYVASSTGALQKFWLG